MSNQTRVNDRSSEAPDLVSQGLPPWKRDLREFLRHWTWWPLLLGPAAIAAVCVAYAAAADKGTILALQTTLDDYSPPLIGLVAGIYMLRIALTRNPLYLLLACLAAAMTVRELHFEDTPAEPYIQKGIYVAAGLVGVWFILWRRRLAAPLWSDWRHTSWLVCTFLMYFISVVVQRRVFKFIPGEKALHRVLEESLEFTSHALFVITCLLGSWRRHGKSASAPAPKP